MEGVYQNNKMIEDLHLTQKI